MNIDEIGEFLEHHGLTDDEIDTYFEHHGVKGQKWGVRKQQRLDRTRRVAEGTGSLGDKARVLGNQSAISLIRGRGLKGAAGRQTQALEALKERTLNGQRTARDVLNNVGGMQLFTVGGTGGKSKPAKTETSTEKVQKADRAQKQSAGEIFARIALAGAGGYVVGRLAGEVLVRM